ncbi:ABC transporter permease [Sutcliffiella halmapala]|uniref:ABC transporter permease n=1 Tax=Sutcliffiella halmapala TaxID=79882 RepID=UPI000994E2D0|nr:ABC transporter permease [Sutcliffiella halmapala]
MNARTLYRSRWKKNWNYQWKNAKTVMDWTIFLYSILTILFLGALLYDSFSSILGIIRKLPLVLTLFFLYLIIWKGSIRVLVEQADSYFFLYRKDILQKLKGYSVLASLFTNGIKSLLLALFSFYMLDLILPNSFPLVMFILFVLLLRYFLIGLTTLINLYWKGWKNRVITFGSFVSMGIISYLLIVNNMWVVGNSSFLVITFAIYVIYWRSDSFSLDVVENEKIKQKYVGMIFYASEYVHVPRVSNRTKPLFFRKSQRIFENRRPENGLSELYLKYCLRNFKSMTSYFQLIGITIAVMVYLPLWLKYAVFLAFFFFIKEWLNIVYDELTTHPFLEMHKGKKLLQDDFQDKVTRWLYYPALGMVGFVLLMSTLFYFLLKG